MNSSATFRITAIIAVILLVVAAVSTGEAIHYRQSFLSAQNVIDNDTTTIATLNSEINTDQTTINFLKAAKTPIYTTSDVRFKRDQDQFGNLGWHVTGLITYHGDGPSMGLIHGTAFAKDGSVVGTGQGTLSADTNGTAQGFDVTLEVAPSTVIDHVMVSVN